MVRFVIDETCWQFDGVDNKSCVDIIEDVLDIVDHAIEYKQLLCYSEDLFLAPVRDGKKFYELYADDSPIEIPHEVRQRIAAIFGRLQPWQDLSFAWPNSFDVIIEGKSPESAPSIAWAHARTSIRTADAVACIVHQECRNSGLLEVVVDGQCTRTWFVSTIQEFQNFFRWLIVQSTKAPDELAALSGPAFQNLDFVEDVFDGIKSMSKPYLNLVAEIVYHLGVFSDHGQRIFSAPWIRAPAEFGSLHVNVSDENGNTKKNDKARLERTKTFRGEPRIFWWHAKIEPDRDRIHICPDKVASGSRIVVGIFCYHLIT
jgi:hypothetical protein